MRRIRFKRRLVLRVAATLACTPILLSAETVIAVALAAGKQMHIPTDTSSTKRVIVTLKIVEDSSPETERIKTAQNRFIADLWRYPVKVLRRHASVPQVTISIDGPGLKYLSTHPAVISVQPDDLAAPTGAPSTATTR